MIEPAANTKPNVHENAVSLRRVSRAYRSGPTSNVILNAVDLVIQRGQFVTLYGPSGSGKSTLLRIIGGLDPVYDGTVLIDGVDVTSLSGAALSAFRACNISFVFQDFKLLHGLDVLTNVAAPLYALGVQHDAIVERARAALALVNLAMRWGSLPEELSGGEQQRVAIARALVSGAGIIVCDEPTGNLNRALAHEIWHLLRDLSKEFGKTLIVATHDEFGADLADEVFEISDGAVTRLLR